MSNDQIDDEYGNQGSQEDLREVAGQAGDQPTDYGDQSGLPGGGRGRRDEVGRTGVYPVSASEGASANAPVEGEMGWGQGERGAEGYYDSGSSEMSPPEGMPSEGDTSQAAPSQGGDQP